MSEVFRNKPVDSRFESSIDSLASRVGCSQEDKSKIKGRIASLLGEYREIMPVGEFDSFIRYINKPSLRRFTISVGPNMEDTGLPIARKQSWDRLSKHLVKLRRDGHIAFSQRPASTLPFRLVSEAIQEGSLEIDGHARILDLCGAPGNKTFNICHLPDVEKVTAVINDGNSSRLGRVRERLAEFQFKSDREEDCYSRKLNDGRDVTIYLSNHDATDPEQVDQMASNYFGGELPNVVIADVFCPGDGRIIENPEVAIRYNKLVYKSGLVQSGILENAIDVAASCPYGVVAYSTCSVSPFFNEGVVSKVLKSEDVFCHNSSFDNVNLFPALHEKYHELKPDGRVRGVRTYPHKMGTGFFCSLISKGDY